MCESFTHLAYYLVERFIAVWEGQHKHTQFGSWCLLMASVVKCWLIYPQSTLWPTLDRPLMNTPSTQYQHSINTLVATWLTLNWHLGWQLVQSQLIFDQCRSWLTLVQLLTDSWSSVNQVSVKLAIKCRWSVNLVSIWVVDWGVSWEYWSTLNHRFLWYTWSESFAFFSKFTTSLFNDQ